MKLPECPQHDKLLAVHEKAQIIGEFMEWLTGVKKVYLGQYHEHTDDCYGEVEVFRLDGNKMVRDVVCGFSEHQLHAIRVDPEALLAEFFEIDQMALEKEKRQLLKQMAELGGT